VDLNELITAFEALILERVAGETFVRRGPLPDFCLRLSADALRQDRPFALDSVFPFLGAYLEDAERVWSAGSNTRAASGFWSETTRDGEELHLEAYPVRVERSEVIVVVRNERLYHQQQLVLQRARELRLAYAELDREMEQKDVLLHTVVYDLASPLQTVLSMLSLLSEAPLGELAAARVGTALEAALREKQLVSEVLEVFSVEQSARAALSPRAATAPDLCSALLRVVSEFEPHARRRDVRLTAELCAAPCHVLGEERRLVRVLANLVDNALRNSPAPAAVNVAARREGEFVIVVVDDDGPTVPVELLPRLFEKHARLGERDNGTGLGLYFCRITLERWGGGAGYEARAAGGARFWIRVRAADEAACKSDS
jgi:signal transduction histidine kinase